MTTNIQQERTNLLKGCGRFEGFHKCGSLGGTYLCEKCRTRLSQHGKTMKLVMEEIDKFRWTLKDIDNKELEEAKHYSGDEVFMEMHNEDLEELKKSLGGEKANEKNK